MYSVHFAELILYILEYYRFMAFHFFVTWFSKVYFCIVHVTFLYPNQIHAWLNNNSSISWQFTRHDFRIANKTSTDLLHYVFLFVAKKKLANPICRILHMIMYFLSLRRQAHMCVLPIFHPLKFCTTFWKIFSIAQMFRIFWKK